MLTSWSEQSTPAELSMKSVLIAAAVAARTRSAPRWVRPRLPPSPTTRPRSSAPLTRIASLACRRRRRGVSRRRLDVGADAAVPEQVDRRLQDRVDQLVGGEAPRPAMPERRADLARERDRLGRARPDAAARGRSATGRSRPSDERGRSNSRCRSAKRLAGSGSGSRKMCRWSNAATSRMCSRQQHAVAEHVAGHVADADDGEVLRLGVEPSSRKWRLTDSQAPLAVMPIFLWS